MKQLIAFRLGMSVVSLVLAAGFVFFLIQLSPTDPVVLALGEGAEQAKVDELTRELGLDRPVLVQFLIWAGRALQGDFGVSYFTDRPVAETLLERLPVTLSLLFGGGFLAVVLGLLAGFGAGLHPDSWIDRALTSTVSLALAVPGFWFALILGEIFAVQLGILPIAGYVPFGDSPLLWARSLVLPCLALGLHGFAVIGRQTRGVVIDVMASPFIEAMRARGLPRGVLVRRYVLKNALVPILPVIGIQLAIIVAIGSVMEKVFVLPGLGSVMVASVIASDFPMLQGAIVIVAAIVILINLLVDIGLGLLDPRVRPQ